MEITLTRKHPRKTGLRARIRRRMAAATRATAMKMTWAVAALQAAVLLTFTLVPPEAPPRLPLMDLLWAASRRPQFYPLVALLVGGPLLSALAWGIRGRHRLMLFLCWTAFTATVFTYHHERIRIMLRVLAREYL